MTSQPERHELISVTVDVACKMTGLGRSTIFELLRDGRLASTKIGARRLILVESLRALVAKAA